MEKIIQKAQEGGYNADIEKYGFGFRYYLMDDAEPTRKEVIVCDPLFWQALGKSCGWEWESKHERFGTRYYGTGAWKENALKFHEINLTESFTSAVAWLEKLIITGEE